MSGAEWVAIIFVSAIPIAIICLFLWLIVVVRSDSKQYEKSYIELDYKEYAKIAEAVIDSTYYGRPIRLVQTDNGKFSKLPKGAYGRW